MSMLLPYGLRLAVGLIVLASVGGKPAPAATSRGTARPGQWSDARLKQVVIGFGEERLDASVFPKVQLRRLLPRIARLQSATPRHERFYFYAAFTLAYFDYEYRRNLARLIYPVNLWEYRRWEEFFTHVSEYDPLENAPVCLWRLYERRRDPALLEQIFTWGFDGAPAEGLGELQKEILRLNALPVFRLAARSIAVTGKLIFLLEHCEAPEEYRPLIRDIRRALRRASPPTRRHGLSLLRKADALNRIWNEEPNLRGADLRGADLSDRDLRNSDLRGADLRGADVRDTDLRRTRLRGAKLRGARYDAKTRWPCGFNPRRHGAVLVR